MQMVFSNMHRHAIRASAPYVQNANEIDERLSNKCVVVFLISNSIRHYRDSRAFYLKSFSMQI